MHEARQVVSIRMPRTGESLKRKKAEVFIYQIWTASPKEILKILNLKFAPEVSRLPDFSPSSH